MMMVFTEQTILESSTDPDIGECIGISMGVRKDGSDKREFFGQVIFKDPQNIAAPIPFSVEVHTDGFSYTFGGLKLKKGDQLLPRTPYDFVCEALTRKVK